MQRRRIQYSNYKNGKIYSATTAAGPAIEGAEIEMGQSGGDGVIYKIEKNGKPVFRGETPKGISGAGLISLIAYLIENGILSAEGHFVPENITELKGGCNSENDTELKGGCVSESVNELKGGCISENKYYLSKEVFVSEKDISGFMVAKSAVKTAIEILMSETETDFSELGLFVMP